MVAPKTPTLLERVVLAADALRARIPAPPAWAWLAEGGIGPMEEDAVRAPGPVAARDLDGFPNGAPGRFLVLGRKGRPILAFDGGDLLAEGASAESVAFPVWVLRRLGAERLLLTGGASSLDPSVESPSIVGIDDHLNFSGFNPLRPPPPEELGPAFPDLARVYDEELLLRAEEAAASARVPFRRGIVASTAGPHFETAAERAFLRSAGAHAVAQSMVIPALAAAHAGFRTLALAAIVDPHRGPAAYADPAAMVRRAATVSEQTAALVRALLSARGA